MRGLISADGTAEISASGTTGDPEHTVGQRKLVPNISMLFKAVSPEGKAEQRASG